jgi:3-deoxy-D-manno-octulosonic-acid transferase
MRLPIASAKAADVLDRLPATLRLYRQAMTAVAPLTPLLLSYRLKRGKEDAARLPERRGESKLARPAGPLVWIHGASVGEIMAVIPLIERMHAAGFQILATSGTVTSAELAQQRLPPGAIHQFVPLDAPPYVTRFLNHWRPNLALFVESDLWPNLIIDCHKRDIPVVLVNGRLSARSFERWNRVPGTIGALLSRLDLCLARTPADAERFDKLGAPRVATTGNLKLDVPAPPADARELAAMKAAIGHRPVVAASSTHPGEETAVIEVHRRLRHSFPGMLTIVAPRHPARGPSIAELAGASGLIAALRSRGEKITGGTDIYVADTVGELGLLYRLAPIVFIGGSLASHGGQNPIEAAKLGAAILHGPNVWNFAELYQALDQAQGAEQVSDAGKLATSIGALLTDAERRKNMADAGRQTVEALGGALERTLQALDPYFMQLRLEHRPTDA